jgi:hypothetical protein
LNPQANHFVSHEVEHVIDAPSLQSFSRAEFLNSLDRRYPAIGQAVATIAAFLKRRQGLFPPRKSAPQLSRMSFMW